MGCGICGGRWSTSTIRQAASSRRRRRRPGAMWHRGRSAGDRGDQPSPPRPPFDEAIRRISMRFVARLRPAGIIQPAAGCFQPASPPREAFDRSPPTPMAAPCRTAPRSRPRKSRAAPLLARAPAAEPRDEILAITSDDDRTPSRRRIYETRFITSTLWYSEQIYTVIEKTRPFCLRCPGTFSVDELRWISFKSKYKPVSNLPRVAALTLAAVRGRRLLIESACHCC